MRKHRSPAERNIMLGFGAKAPISPEAGQWIEASFARFIDIFGGEQMRTGPVVLPTAEFFPDEGETPDERVHSFFQRVCGYMGVDPGRIDLEVFHDEIDDLQDALKQSLPAWEGSRSGAAGLYHGAHPELRRAVISIQQKQLQDPVSLVATLAHEVGHEL